MTARTPIRLSQFPAPQLSSQPQTPDRPLHGKRRTRRQPDRGEHEFVRRPVGSWKPVVSQTGHTQPAQATSRRPANLTLAELPTSDRLVRFVDRGFRISWLDTKGVSKQPAIDGVSAASRRSAGPGRRRAWRRASAAPKLCAIRVWPAQRPTAVRSASGERGELS